MADSENNDDVGKPANGTTPVEQIAELVRRLCIAQSQAIIYSPDHPVAERSMKEAFAWLSRMLKGRKKPLIISMTEGKILFDGLPIEEQNPLVARFSRRLEEIHMNNIFFDPGLTLDELQVFHRFLAAGTTQINESGGLTKLLKEEGVSHITTQEASYVLLTKDQKVVGRDAKVTTMEIDTEDDVDAEITRYMLAEVMRKADEKKWLLTEIKNHPQKMASRIVDGIELATSRAEMGIESEGDSIETLLDNIRLVGQSMARSEVGEDEETEDIEESILTLEKELRSRSGQLTSGRVASGFVNEILGVITSFSDQVKAKRLAHEFLQGETSLKRTEDLLKKLKPDTESSDEFLGRIRELLVDRGITRDEMDKLLSEVRRKEPKAAFELPDEPEAPAAETAVTEAPAEVPAPAEEAEATGPEAPAPEPVLPRKKLPGKFIREVRDAVQAQLASAGIKSGPKLKEGVQRLVVYVDQKIKEREGEIWNEAEEYVQEKETEFKAEVQLTQAAQVRREHLLEIQNTGAILWNEQGDVEYINETAQTLLGLKVGDPLTDEVIAEMDKLSFPLGSLLPEYCEDNGWEETERKLLSAIMATIKDEQGRAVGAILSPLIGITNLEPT